MITPEQLAKSGTEHGAQAALFCWANLNLDKYPELKWLFAIPNGFAGVIAKSKMKSEGLKSGVPDICLLASRAPYGGKDRYAALWIELKVGKNKASDKQNEWLGQARVCGHGAIVCYGWEHARDTIIQYLEYK